MSQVGAMIQYDTSATDTWVPQHLAVLLGRDYFDTVSGVTLNQMVSDEDLESVMQLPRLTALRVKTGDRQQPTEWLTDVTLGRLAKLPRLKYLIIEGGRFTKRGFEALDASPSLVAGRVTSVRWAHTTDPIRKYRGHQHDLGAKKHSSLSTK